MNTDSDIKHFTDEEITLYSKKVLGHEDMSRLTRHLEGCESCRKAVVEAQTFSELIYNAIEGGFSNERKKDCLSEMDISAYLEKQATAEERMHMEKHLSRCNYCLSLLVETEKSLREGIREEEPHFSYEKVIRALKQQLKQNRGKSLLEKFAVLIKNSPPTAQKALKNLKNIKALLNNTFTYPSPRFAPVFGEHRVTVLSPFGKVRYPIIFEWLPFEGADSYTISIEDTGWSFTTKKTKVAVNPEELKLDYGKEYMWELKVLKEKKGN